MPGPITQQININVQDAPLPPPAAPNTGLGGFLSGLTDAIAGVTSNHLGLIISAVLLLALVAAGIILSRKHLRTNRSRVSFLSLFLIPVAGFVIAAAGPVQAVSDLVLQTNTNSLTINLTKGQGATASTTSTTTVSTTNSTGYLLTASLDQASLDTLTDNNIDLSLTGGDVTDQTFTTAGQAEELLETNAAATDEATDFTIKVTVPSTITAGVYAVALNYDAADNALTTPATMQAMTQAYCANYMSVYPDTTNGPNTLTLTDTRNNQDYMVRKLADNNCWMVNNLKISLSDVAASPTASNPGINTTALLAQTAPDNAGSLYYDQPRYYDPSSLSSDPNDIASDQFYGYMYNWCAVTGATSATCKGTPATNAATTDICPASWRLPIGESNGEFAVLNNAMQTGSLTPSNSSSYYANWQHSGPFKGVFSGRWFGYFLNQGTGGDLQSSSIDAASSIGGLNFGSSSVNANFKINLHGGYSARCVLK